MVARESTARDEDGPEFNPDMPVLGGERALAWASDQPPPRLGDDEWRLPAHGPDAAVARYSLLWGDAPPTFVEGLKWVARALLNCPTPTGALERSTWARSLLSDSTVYRVVSHLKLFAKWIDERGVRNFEDVDEATLWAYIVHLENLDLSRRTAYDRAWAVTRLWLHGGYAPARHQLRQPPWEIPGEPSLSEIFGQQKRPPENATEPIDPDVWDLLWSWAEWFIREAGPDIVRAKEARDAMRAGLRKQAEPGDEARFREWLAARKRNGEALPGWRYNGRLVAGREYIALQAGVGLRAIRRYEATLAERSAPIDSSIEGRIEGRPWIDAIDYYEVDPLAQQLATASAIVIAALTGMRSQELRSLKRGCCQRIDRGPGVPPGYELRGRTFKVTDEEGNAIRGGTMRDHPWWAIPPVPQAVEVLERLHGDDLLFPSDIFGSKPGTPVLAQQLNVCIQGFIAWCNTTARRLGLHGATIDEDPAGTITTRRFRRTIARAIQRRRFGRIANGVLLGHMSLHTTDGYGTHVFSEQRDVRRQEEDLAIFERLQSAAECLDAGEGVSGAAATDYIAVVTEFAGKRFTASQERAVRENPAASLYENDHLYVMCLYRGDQALCHPDNARQPDGAQSPDLTNCDIRCPNVVYTDRNIADMEEAARQERAKAESPGTPLPEVVRFTQRAERMEEIIAKHRETRIVDPRDVT